VDAWTRAERNTVGTVTVDHGSGHTLDLRVTVSKSSHGSRGCVHCVPAGIPGAGIVLPGEVAGCERAGSVTRWLSRCYLPAAAVKQRTPPGDFTPDSVSSWTAFLAPARISEDVIRREICDSYTVYVM